MSTTVPTLVPPGFEFRYFEETVTLTTAAASFSLTNTLPIGAVPYAASLQLLSTVSAATAVKVGLGRVTSTADPDKYILTSDLTAQSSATMITPTTPLAAAETVGIFACATGGTAAGTIGGAGELVKISMTYAIAQLPT
jgi:hypothetical protein